MKELYAEYNCNLDDAQIEKHIEEILEKEYASNNNVDVYKKCFNMIDLTSLNSTDTEEKIAAMMEKVNAFKSEYPDMPNVAAVCVYPAMVPVTKETLKVEGVNIAAVSACFPSSQTFIEAKVAETALTVAAGADEIDVVISIGKLFSGNHTEVTDELIELKAACRKAHMKVIIESGALRNANEIKHASLCGIASGAEFIKTSTGKMEPAATLKAAYVMCGAIKEYYEKSGIRIGFKPAGGIATTDEAVKFYTVVKHILGEDWMNNHLFRFGASRLANNLLTSIYGKEVAYF